ncbi:MAG TPA: ParB/RepB/Spo0J family partition protein, partial [Candidatus Hydrogenedentes bacterium]|nr:ParB/RepB/Spo0J family partition protein [Candidatus Hydrogenedentota bacterium]
MAEGKKKALGRGLTALISVRPEEPATAEAPQRGESGDGDRVLHLDPTTLKPNPKQPRKAFREEALEELAASIKRDGVQEPVIVRKGEDGYELVSGERRVRACIMAGLDKIPAIRRDVSDTDMLKLGLIENI